jgi:hypothetical protein
MATVTDQREQAERDAAREELMRQRAVKAAELQKLDDKLAQVSDADFMARLGRMQVSEMTVKEKSELVSRLGLAGFEKLLGVR